MENLKNKQEYWIPVFRFPEGKKGAAPRKLIASFEIENEEGKLVGMRNEKQEFVCCVPKENLCKTEEEARNQDAEFQKKLEFLKNLKEAWFADVHTSDNISYRFVAGIGKCAKKELIYCVATYNMQYYEWRVYTSEYDFIASVPFDAVFATREEAMEYALKEKQRLLRIEREKLNQIELQDIKEIK